MKVCKYLFTSEPVTERPPNKISDILLVFKTTFATTADMVEQWRADKTVSSLSA